MEIFFFLFAPKKITFGVDVGVDLVMYQDDCHVRREAFYLSAVHVQMMLHRRIQWPLQEL